MTAMGVDVSVAVFFGGWETGSAMAMITDTTENVSSVAAVAVKLEDLSRQP